MKKHHPFKNVIRLTMTALLFCMIVQTSSRSSSGAEEEKVQIAKNALVMVVMDPLARELSCPCVKGYAQRDYIVLGKYIEGKIGRPVSVVFSGSLVTAMKEKSDGRADIVIGKKSVIDFDAKRLDLNFTPVASLTGKDGAITQTGLIVVPSKDPAKTVADLKNYLIVFGPEDCAEKNSAAIALLKKNNVAIPDKLETAGGCDTGATRVLELPEGEHGAAVISSYAKPLLEGCGTVPKGALRVVGETSPVPFVTAYVSSSLTSSDKKAVTQLLLEIREEESLCKSLETLDGFIAWKEATSSKKASGGTSSSEKSPSDVKKK
jgi:ABC-type phosphate/phosphonate transport system substrate-binding protein